jgi:hypothetical protein
MGLGLQEVRRVGSLLRRVELWLFVLLLLFTLLYFYIAERRDCFFFWSMTLAMEGDISLSTA